MPRGILHVFMISFHNTLTKKKELFKPIDSGSVRMYTCGPTVYNFAHIGNLRSYVFADIVRRSLIAEGLRVTQVINVTDIGHLTDDGDSGDDKMTKALIREGKPLTLTAMREVADFYFARFLEDLSSLNIERVEHYPFASDHINEDIALVQTLTDKGFTYTINDGIYFDTSKFEGYGKLGGGVAGIDHSRIAQNDEKRNARDFAVWKFNSELGYEAPFGKGFPGWHIECSAMSMKYLGESFDIHTGGIDHIPVHHNNEIAQSECATGKPYAHTWLHNAHVQIEGGKMAKSEGNFITLQALRDAGIHPLSYRYWLLQARYSTEMSYSQESVLAAQNGFDSLLQNILALKVENEEGNVNSIWMNTFMEHIEDDLNTAGAIASLHDLLSASHIPDREKLATVYKADHVLGLNIKSLCESLVSSAPKEILDLQAKRDELKVTKQWAESDAIRDTMANMGYIIHDSPEGTRITRTLRSLIG